MIRQQIHFEKDDHMFFEGPLIFPKKINPDYKTFRFISHTRFNRSVVEKSIKKHGRFKESDNPDFIVTTIPRLKKVALPVTTLVGESIIESYHATFNSNADAYSFRALKAYFSNTPLILTTTFSKYLHDNNDLDYETAKAIMMKIKSCDNGIKKIAADELMQYNPYKFKFSMNIILDQGNISLFNSPLSTLSKMFFKDIMTLSSSASSLQRENEKNSIGIEDYYLSLDLLDYLESSDDIHDIKVIRHPHWSEKTEQKQQEIDWNV